MSRPPKAGLPPSPREAEVLQMAADGMKYAEIAARLYLTEDTVKNFMWRIRRKLGARRSDNLLDLARQHGLLPATGKDTP